MTYPRTVTLALLLCLSSCSSHPTTLLAPHLERSAQRLSHKVEVDPRYDLAGLIRKVEVRVQKDELLMVLWSPLAMDSLGSDPVRGFSVQAIFDTDRNPDTYPYGNYVARVIERQGDAFPVRIGAVDEFDPGSSDPGAGGWGEISGWAEMDASKHRLALHIPLAALGNDDGILDWELDVYRNLDASAVRGTTR